MTSKAEIDNFLHELNQNSRMQAELQALSEDSRQEITADDLVRFAAAHGYSIAVNELTGERLQS